MAAESVAALARAFLHFAEADCDDPLYAVLCRHVAASQDLLGMMLAAPREQQKPNLLFAAVHDLVLAGRGDALAGYFPSAGGTRAIDAALPTVFDAFVTREHEALVDRITHRSTQTNEIGRCAIAWPALRELAARRQRPRIALLDFGCSAGLNLGVDEWPIDYGMFSLGPPMQADRPTLACRLIGEGRPATEAEQPSPQIVSRLGIDPSPVDVQDDEAVRWLRACIWPHDRERRQRLDQAVAIARRARWPVQREADCGAAVDRWLDSLPPDVLPVVMNSWVLFYFEREALARHVERMLQRVAERGMAWLSAELTTLVIGDAELPPTVDDIAMNTLWTLSWRDERTGRARSHVIARSHPHGRWQQWLGLPSDNAARP